MQFYQEMKVYKYVCDPMAWLLIIFILFFTSCQEDDHLQREGLEIIKIDLDEMSMPDIKIDKIIPLETSEESLIERVNRISIFEERIYILEVHNLKTIVLFDIEGNYIKKIPIGKGPGEIVFPGDYYLDRKNKRLLVWDWHGYKMLKCSLDLDHISSIDVKVKIKKFTLTPENQVLAQVHHIPGTKFFSYKIFSPDLDSTVSRLLPYSEKLGHWGLRNPISREPEGELVFSRVFDRNIYGLQNGQEYIKYQLDFGKLNVSEKDYKDNEEMPFILAGDGKRIANMDDLIHTQKYLGFTIFFKSEPQFIIHSITTNQNYYSTDLFAGNVLPFGRLKGMYGDRFVLICDAESLITFCTNSGLFSGLCEKILPDGNPFLILFKVH